MLFSQHSSRALLLVLAPALLAGCRDDRGPGASPLGLPDGPASYVAPQQFDAIDRNDTHFSMQVTAYNSTSVTLQQPVYDAAIGQQTTVLSFAAPPEDLYIEGGYDGAGRVRVNHYRAPDNTDPLFGITDEARTLKTTGNQFTQFDTQGWPISVQIPPDAVGFSPLSEIGSLDNASITSGVIIDEASVDPNAPRPMALADDDPLERENGAHKVERSKDRIVITTFFPEDDGESGGEVGMAAAASASGGTGGHGKLVRTYRKQGDKFVLAEVDLTSETRTEAAVFASRTTLKVVKVKWKENKDKDKKRKEERVKRREGTKSTESVRAR